MNNKAEVTIFQAMIQLILVLRHPTHLGSMTPITESEMMGVCPSFLTELDSG
jgi:hypothetical protein